MQSGAAAVALVLLLGGLSAAEAREADEHPIQEVITMIEGLMAKAKKEGEAEANTYAKFKYWCDSSIAKLKRTIEKESETIVTLTTTITAKTKEQGTLEVQIAELEKEIARLQAAEKYSKEKRDAEHKKWEEADKDFKETISALEEAIKALLEAKGKVSLVQVSGKVREALLLAEVFAPVETRPTIKAFLQDPSLLQQPNAGDYAAHQKKYNFKSDNIIELLKQLKMQFQEDMTEATKAETNAQNAYELALLSMKKLGNNQMSSKDEKSDVKSVVETIKTEATATKKNVEEDKTADQATLAETMKACAIKAAEWAERSKVREMELKAMHTAIEILSKVSGVRTEAPGNPVPPPSPVSFLQESPGTDPKVRAVNLLRAEARVMHSRALERLAQEVAVHLSGPLDEVVQMVQKMIFRLMAEQKDEDDHKNWCDMEIEKTNTSKIDKEDTIEDLVVKINSATTKIQKLADDIVEANEMVSSIETHVEKATEIREIGKKENALALKDAQDAQKAVSDAIAVLDAFYKESGMVEKADWELLQAPVDLPAQPETWDASYTGVSDPTAQPGGIITLMKEVSADFASMEADTKAQEASDKEEYDKEMQDCSIEKARRAKESEMKSQEQKRLQDKVQSLEEQKKHVSDELSSVVQYLKDLEPACVSGDSTYEDRKAARTKEIEALRQAQTILEGAFREKDDAGAPGAAFLARRQK